MSARSRDRRGSIRGTGRAPRTSGAAVLAQTIGVRVLLVRFAAGGHIVPEHPMVTHAQWQRERLYDPTRQIVLQLEDPLQLRLSRVRPDERAARVLR